MGSHMGRRLAEAGYAVTVWNRDRTKAEKLARFGATVSANPSTACASADVTIVMLSNGPVVDEVIFAHDDLARMPAEVMRRDSVLVVMSSIPVETCQAQAASLAARGVSYVDAPVSGGEPGARDGTLAIMAGGDRKVIERLTDVFAVLGRLTHVGAVGSGQLAKLANQIIVGGTIAAIAEALHFASRGGADAAAVREALMGGFGDSKILSIHGARMIERDFVPGSPAEYQLKDLHTAHVLADRYGLRLRLLDCLLSTFEDMINHFGNGLDVSGVLREVERHSAAIDSPRMEST
jgi:3-hydroxyisobutyrate dehydrogenase-like beta-hydroxyacid dehydrogenase